MMAENPSFWWSLSGKPPLASQQPSTTFLPVPSSIPMPPPPPSSNFFSPQYIFGTSPQVLPPSSLLHHDHYNQDHFPLSWSHLLMGGLANDLEERGGTSSSTDGQLKKLETWEDQVLNNNPSSRTTTTIPDVKVKQELDHQITRELMIYNNNIHAGDHDDELQACSSSNWSTQAVNPVLSAAAFSSSTINSVLDFSTNYKRKNGRNENSHTYSSDQCNGTSTIIAPAKKARVQSSSSTQPPLKVRKEKLGDRITALHQIVSPFGKTDTASVLLEAIGFIRFLECQIEALTSPKLGNNASATTTTMTQYYPCVKAEMQCITTEDAGQLLNDDYQKRGRAPKQDGANDHTATDLRSRGLCLVPVSCTDHINLGGNNGLSEYWAPTLGGGGCGGF